MSEKKDMENISTENLSPLQREILKKWRKSATQRSVTIIAQEIRDELQIKFEGEVLFDESMAKHTYIKIGGNADVFLKPKSKAAILFAVKLAEEHGIPYCFHGAGANTLVKDGGLRGFVISAYNTLCEHRVLEKTDDHVDVEVGAGLNFNKLCHIARDLGVADLAPLSGIPGCVGGLISMNAGTQVREIKDVLRSILVLTKEGEEITISREKLDFEYRQLKMPKTNFIVSAVFRFQDFLPPDEIENQIKKYQQRRSDTQPLEFPNLGSMFKNPLPASKKEIVVTAGQLIEDAGLKNVRVGGARISAKHANFIINEGTAMANDVITLINMIKDKVKQTSGVQLETEVKIMGEDRDEK